jgi:hypothetical protein
MDQQTNNRRNRMKYTKLKDIGNLSDKDIVEAVAGSIAFVGDPETKQAANSGKPYTKQAIKLISSDGAEVWCDIINEHSFLDRADKNKKVIICSTVKDGKMQGLSVNKWGDKPARLTLASGVNVTFPESGSTPATASQPQQQSQPSQQKHEQPKQQSQPVNGLQSIKLLWKELYEFALPVCGETNAVAAAATMFIEANKRNIGPTITKPADAIKALQPDARKIADVVITKGEYDHEKLPDGDDLDAVVDLLIDKLAEEYSRERINTAFDSALEKITEKSGRSRNDAVKLLVSDWSTFINTLK